MIKYLVIFMLSFFMLQTTFADDATSMPDATATPATATPTPDATAMPATSSDETSLKQCKNIVNACMNSGYVRKGGPGKAFWKDCMKPVLLGQPVTGVTIDPNDVKVCRQFKITKMQQELQELQQQQ